MRRLLPQPRADPRLDRQGLRGRWSLRGALLALVLLSACAQAEQRADQPSPAPLSPAPATPNASTAMAATPSTPVFIRPTPNETQLAASATVAFLKTSIADSRNEDRATATAKAAWAQTPEPTILPPADGPRLRDLWPAAPQQATAPTRLYLRSFSNRAFDPDTFWEVSLPDAQTRRLPAVEENSIDPSAQVSPDGRFLAYVTGNGKVMERTLRLLDISQDTHRLVVKFVSAGFLRCLQPFAWSLDGRSLAVITLQETGPFSLLQLYPNVENNQAPQTLAELPDEVRLIGWLDADHLLLSRWKPSIRLAELWSVDRQGHISLVTEPQSERLECASLSPDRQTLIYNQGHQVKRLQLGIGQEEPFPWWPDDLFWVGDGHTLLISRFGTDRQVWLRSLDQPEEQSGIFLSPPYQAAYEFGIIGVSPDNRTLVACEHAPADNPRIHTRESRIWLYSLPDERWTLVRSNPEGPCDFVLGWSSAGV